MKVLNPILKKSKIILLHILLKKAIPFFFLVTLHLNFLKNGNLKTVQFTKVD